jgi:hypothetical protein
MKVQICIISLILMYATILMGQEDFPGIQGPAPYKEGEIIVNPDNGDKIICNQLQIIFVDNLNREQKSSALKKVNGKMAGYLEDLDIYQIIITNPKCDFNELKKQREKLIHNKLVYQVSYRVVEGSGLDKIDVGKLKPKRQGQLDMQPAERKKKEEPTQMELALNKNKATLHSCLQQFPGVHGQVEFRVIIDENGSVSQVVILQSTVSNKKITDCMKYKVGKWHDFPPEPRGFDRNLEFSFKF